MNELKVIFGYSNSMDDCSGLFKSYYLCKTDWIQNHWTFLATFQNSIRSNLQSNANHFEYLWEKILITIEYFVNFDYMLTNVRF